MFGSVKSLTTDCVTEQLRLLQLTFYSAEAIIVPHRMILSWYTGRWWVGCYIWYSEEVLGGAPARPGPSSLYQM